MNFGKPTTGGFGSAPTGFGVAPAPAPAPAPTGGFGAAPTGFGAAPASAGGFGAAPTGFGAAPAPTGGFGAASTGFGTAPTSIGGFGAPSTGFGASTAFTLSTTNKPTTGGLGVPSFGTAGTSWGSGQQQQQQQQQQNTRGEVFEGEKEIRQIQFAYAPLLQKNAQNEYIPKSRRDQMQPSVGTSQLADNYIRNENDCEFDSIMFDEKSKVTSHLLLLVLYF